MSLALRITIVAVGALLIVLAFGAFSIMRDDRPPTPGPQPSPSPTEVTQDTLLLQVLDADRYAYADAVIGNSPTGQPPLTTVLAVPASLMVPVGDDTITLGMTPTQNDTLAGVKGVSTALDLRIDAGLSLDRLAFAGLVDGVGGVWVRLDAPVTIPARDSEPQQLLPAGWNRLDGVTAADYAMMRLPGESQDVRQMRFEAVWDAIVYRLPYTPERMRQLMTSLGSLAATTVPTEQLIPFLLQMRENVHDRAMRTERLPVHIIRQGIRPASVPADGANALLDDLFPDARTAGVTE